jgi:hypothetical protein
MIKLALGVAGIVAGLTVQSCSSSRSGSYSDYAPTTNRTWADTLPRRALDIARSGDPAAIHIVRTTTKPFEGCARPNAFGWTNAHGNQLAADELAWFLGHMPSDPNCSAFLYLFHDASQTTRSGFNAGAVIYDGGLMSVQVGSVTNGPTYTFQAH